MAISSPAWTQWYKKTELKTSLPAGGKPKDTFDIPKIVLVRGRVSFINRTPSIVSAADPI